MFIILSKIVGGIKTFFIFDQSVQYCTLAKKNRLWQEDLKYLTKK